MKKLLCAILILTVVAFVFVACKDVDEHLGNETSEIGGTNADTTSDKTVDGSSEEEIDVSGTGTTEAQTTEGGGDETTTEGGGDETTTEGGGADTTTEDGSGETTTEYEWGPPFNPTPPAN